MKTYEMQLEDGGVGVFKVSIVKDPAIESNLIFFSAEKPDVLTFTNEEKKVIYSVVMRPNKLIYRKDVNGEPANVFYTSKTVEDMQINYFRQNGNKATNINHSDEGDAEGVFPFENWIVRDELTDIATKMGLEVKNGDWVMGYKVDNQELWEGFIKTGKLDGLSIEAMHINHKLITENMTVETPVQKEKSFWDELLDFVNMSKEKHAEDEKPADPAADEPAVETPAEEPVVEQVEHEPAAEPVVEVPAAEAAEGDAEPTEKEVLLQKRIDELELKLSTLMAEKIKSDTALETMAAQTPAARAIINAPAVIKTPKKYEEMSNFEKLKFNKENKK
jgi:hypothetical protein